jgi:hypothetical protein
MLYDRDYNGLGEQGLARRRLLPLLLTGAAGGPGVTHGQAWPHVQSPATLGCRRGPAAGLGRGGVSGACHASAFCALAASGGGEAMMRSMVAPVARGVVTVVVFAEG